jgi:hypothetical protein
MTIENRLRNAVRDPAQIDAQFKVITAAIKRLYTKDVQVGIVVGLRNGDPFDFSIAGTMTADDIAWAGQVAMVQLATVHAIKDRLAEQTTPSTAPKGVPQETWENLPPELQSLIRNITAEGGEIVGISELPPDANGPLDDDLSRLADDGCPHHDDEGSY